MAKRIPNKSRHIRWNWERSEDNFEMDNPFVRYHIVVVDDKNREGIMEKILNQLQKVTEGIELIRKTEGKVKGSKFRYLFGTYDSMVAPRIIDWSGISKNVKRDPQLRERVKEGHTIEDYVFNIYER